jgi:hypothetical protein
LTNGITSFRLKGKTMRDQNVALIRVASAIFIGESGTDKPIVVLKTLA